MGDCTGDGAELVGTGRLGDPSSLSLPVWHLECSTEVSALPSVPEGTPLRRLTVVARSRHLSPQQAEPTQLERTECLEDTIPLTLEGAPGLRQATSRIRLGWAGRG